MKGLFNKILPNGSSLKWSKAGLLILLAALALTAGAFYYQAETARLKQDRLNELTTIGEFKAKHIAQWRRERILDVEPVITSPFKDVFVDWLDNQDDLQRKEGIQQRLEIFVTLQDYIEAMIVTKDGQILLSTKGRDGPVGQETLVTVQDVITRPVIKLSDPYYADEGMGGRT